MPKKQSEQRAGASAAASGSGAAMAPKAVRWVSECVHCRTASIMFMASETTAEWEAEHGMSLDSFLKNHDCSVGRRLSNMKAVVNAAKAREAAASKAKAKRNADAAQQL